MSAELSIYTAPLSAKFYRRYIFWRNFIPSFGFLYIVPTLATAPFGQNFTPFAIGINRAACFVAKFYAAHARYSIAVCFISKRLLETKTCRYTAWLYLVSATACKPQILNLTRAVLRQNFAEILLAALQNSIFYPKPPQAHVKPAR